MKITKWEFEGTPDELRQVPELQTAFGTPPAVSPAAMPSLAPVEGLVPSECATIIRRWARTPQRAELMLNLAERLVLTDAFVLEPGKSGKTEDGLNDYVLVYRRGKRTIGCVAYLNPARMQLLLRLPAETAAEHPDTELRGTTGKYRVQYIVDGADSIDRAVELVQAALEYADVA